MPHFSVHFFQSLQERSMTFHDPRGPLSKIVSASSIAAANYCTESMNGSPRNYSLLVTVCEVIPFSMLYLDTF